MTEHSIARSIADFVCEQLPPEGPDSAQIGAVRLRIGVLCGVTASALRSAFRCAVVGTRLSETAIDIEFVDLVVWCPQCHQEQLLTDTRQLRCPVCQAKTPHVVQGNEFDIAAVEWAPSPVTAAPMV